MKIVTVLGARPQFIKASVVSAALADCDVEEVLVHTGQHFDQNMSDVFFRELGMATPRFHLGISGGGHGEMTGRMLASIERVLIDERPDAVLVYGDTNSTLAGAIAAVKLRIPVAHVEAGLRSFNLAMPEEVNRILADRISHWLFVPTADAVLNLRSEGISQSRIFEVGDVMYDVALDHGKRAMSTDRRSPDFLGVADAPYALVTIHRAENTDVPARLGAIVDGIIALSRDIKVVWPLHPRTRIALVRYGLIDRLGLAVTLVEPQGYLDMVRLERSAAVIATDSGGVQKEAFFHHVPCVTLREETEWVELVESGWNLLHPPVEGVEVYRAILSQIGVSGSEISPYGDGHASAAIARVLSESSR